MIPNLVMQECEVHCNKLIYRDNYTIQLDHHEINTLSNNEMFQLISKQ